MTDRDHFAAAALTALLHYGDTPTDITVSEAYRYADAMIAYGDAHPPPPRSRPKPPPTKPPPTTVPGPGVRGIP